MSRIPKAKLFLKRGYWWINYSLNGERHRISSGTKDRNLAEIKRNDIELKLFKGEMGVKPKTPSKSSLPEFFRRYTEYLISEESIDRHPDLARLRSWQLYFARKGIKHLDDIRPGLIDDFRITVLAKRKPKTIKNYIMLLKTALNKAVSWGLIDNNTIANVKPPKVVRTFHFFNRDEIGHLIEEAEEPLKTGIIILVNTGMRRGELYNMRWRDVDMANKRLRVWPYDGFSPKGKRPRSIPFTDQLAETMGKLFREKAKNDEYVFRPYDGPNTLYRHFSALTKKFGIKGTLHDLRHTFASHLAMAGVTIPIIKELLGHSDIATTMIYAHLSPDIHKAEIQKLPFGWCPNGARNAPKIPKTTPKKVSKKKHKSH